MRLFAIGLLLLTMPAVSVLGADGGAGRILLQTKYFTLRAGTGEVLWSYSITGARQHFRFSPPMLEIDHRAFRCRVKWWKEVGGTTLLRNGAEEKIFQGILEEDSSIHFFVRFRWAADNPVVKFRYRWSDGGGHRLTKTGGKDNLQYYTTHFSPGWHFKEIRLSSFNEKTHATQLAEAAIGAGSFSDGDSLMGPLLEATGNGGTFLLGYEHGSQYPDRFLEYVLSRPGSLGLRAVKGNYLDGQPLAQADGNVLETIWMEAGGVQGDEEGMASSYRRFVLRYMSENTESRKPYIFYNTWGRQERTKWAGGKYLSSMNLVTTLQEIETAHRMGIEVYVLDAGWFQSTGDWKVNTLFFPDSLRQVRALLEKYGMKLGLWLNPTVAAVSSEMLKRNNAFRMEWEGRTDDPFPIWETENSVRLDLVSPYWKDFADRLIQLVKELGVSYFKWDAVGQYGCDGAGHFHGAGTNSREERMESYAFQLPIYMSKVIDRVCAAAPQTIFDFDITEPGRSVGLGFLSSGKYFIMNNGPYYDDYDIAAPGATPLANGNVNIFVYPGPARGWFTRSVLGYDKWIPSILFLTHYQPDEPRNSQMINIASLILGQNGIWGEILKTSPEGVSLFHDLLGKYKEVRDDITVSDPVRSGEPGSSPEIVEKINPVNGRGAVVIFASAAGRYRYITSHAASLRSWSTEGATVWYDREGRAIITAEFREPGARIVFFNGQENNK